MGRSRTAMTSSLQFYRSPLVRGALRAVQAAGHDSDAFAARHALSPRAAQEPETAIPLASCRRFMAESAERVGVPSIGFHLATTLPRGYLGVLDASTMSAPTLGDAARRFVQLLPLITPLLRAELVDTGRTVTLRQWIDGEPDAQGDHGNEFVPAAMVRHVRELVGDARAITEVLFAHRRPRHAAKLAEFFDPIPLRFGTGVNGMVIARDVIERPQLAANPALLAALDGYAAALLRDARPDDAQFLHEVRVAIRGNLTHSDVLLPRVAHVLGTSARTLQRRLHHRGISFRALVDDVRREAIAALHANSRLGAGAIASLLGYRERSSLSRATRRWRAQARRSPPD